MKLYTPLSHACYFGDSDLMSSLVPITIAHGGGIAKVAIDGVDVNVAWPSLETNKLASVIQKASGDGLELAMIDSVLDHGVEIVKTKTLRTFNREVGYTLSQGQ